MKKLDWNQENTDWSQATIFSEGLFVLFGHSFQTFSCINYIFSNDQISLVTNKDPKIWRKIVKLKDLHMNILILLMQMNKYKQCF